MATIRKRQSKYQVQLRRKGFITQSRSFKNKQDALEWSRFMEIKADRGELPASRRELNRYLVSDIVHRYMNEITVKKLSQNTEAYILQAFLRTPLATMTLTEITTHHFVKYRNKRLKTVKAGTVNRELGIIQHAFSIAKDQWDIPILENPLSSLKKLPVSNARNRRLEGNELRLLLDKTTNSNNPYIKVFVLLKQLLVSFALSSEIMP